MFNFDTLTVENRSSPSLKKTKKSILKRSLLEKSQLENDKPVNAKKLWKILAGNIIEHDYHARFDSESSVERCFPTKKNFFMRNIVSMNKNWNSNHTLRSNNHSKEYSDSFSVERIRFHSPRINKIPNYNDDDFAKIEKLGSSFDEAMKSEKFFNEKDIKKYIRSSTCHCRNCGKNTEKFIFSNYVSQVNEARVKIRNKNRTRMKDIFNSTKTKAILTIQSLKRGGRSKSKKSTVMGISSEVFDMAVSKSNTIFIKKFRSPIRNKSKIVAEKGKIEPNMTKFNFSRSNAKMKTDLGIYSEYSSPETKDPRFLHLRNKGKRSSILLEGLSSSKKLFIPNSNENVDCSDQKEGVPKRKKSSVSAKMNNLSDCGTKKNLDFLKKGAKLDLNHEAALKIAIKNSHRLGAFLRKEKLPKISKSTRGRSNY